MKIDNKTTNKIIEIVKLAKTLGLDKLSIEPTVIRGISEDSKILLVENQNLIDNVDFIMAITRIKTLHDRFAAITNDKLEIDADSKTTDSADLYLSNLSMKNKRTTITYRCSDPKLIKIPKKLSSAFAYEFTLNDEALDFILKARSAMAADKFSLIFKDSIVKFNINDDEGDKLDHIISDNYTVLNNNEESFMVNFTARDLLPLLKLAINNPTKEISCRFTSRGTINFTINNYNIYVTPVLD